MQVAQVTTVVFHVSTIYRRRHVGIVSPLHQ